MSVLAFNRLETRYVVAVAIGLLVFSLIAGLFTYGYSYRKEFERADSLQSQLVATVQVQAEVAVFARNTEIAHGVLEGLLANSLIQAARIEAADGFKAELGTRQNVNFVSGRAYPLFSPVDHIEPIGSLVVVQNDSQVDAAARRVAVLQTLMMLAQVLIGSLFMVIIMRKMMINPIVRLAQEMTAIEPGSCTRLRLDDDHAKDEIGQLSRSANSLLDAAENALDEVKAQRNELERLATHDYLTGLATMRVAEDRLNVACTAARRANEKVALLFLDLDEFKNVNDLHGHEAGNEVLKEVASRLRKGVRAEDTVARLGGDEFVVILAGLQDSSAAVLVAENIGRSLALPYFHSGHSSYLSASIGIAIFPDHTKQIEAMRVIADQAMYKAKKSGKNACALADPVPE